VKQIAISSFIIDLCSNLYNFINQVVSCYANSMDLENILCVRVVVTVLAAHAALVTQ